MIFVFGSNLAGRHGKGAALYARNNYGAEYGVGVGRTGNAYAIPTKDERIKTLPLNRIAGYVSDFLAYARTHKDDLFLVTRIGCGLAGYKDDEIKPMFQGAPKNCCLPDGWMTDGQALNKYREAVGLFNEIIEAGRETKSEIISQLNEDLKG